MANESGRIFGGVTFTQEVKAFQNIAERLAAHSEMFWRFGDDIMFRMRVCMPAKVLEFNAEKQTIKAQILIRERIKNLNDGSIEWVEIEPIADIPIHYPQGKNFIVTFPLEEGDEVLLIFNDSCIDSWWENGGTQNWIDRRRHDITDCFAIPGVNSVPNTLHSQDENAGINPDAIELRTKNGQTRISLEDEAIKLYRKNDDGDLKTEVEITEDHFVAFHDDQTLSLSDSNTVFFFDANTYIKLQTDQIDIKASVINLDGTVNILSNDFNTTNNVGALLPWWFHTHRYVQPGVGAFSTNAADNPYPTHA